MEEINKDKVYLCECGRTFNTPNAFNGHKSYCRIHLESCGKLDKFFLDDGVRRTKAKEGINKRKEVLLKDKQSRDQDNLLRWISEQHTCERCGKVMVEKYASGRFCSKFCANSRKQTSDVKERISKSVKTHLLNKPTKPKISPDIYYLNPSKCVDCYSVLSFERRRCLRCIVCTDKHKRNLLSQKSRSAVLKNGGNLNSRGVRGTAKYGVYRGFSCDSSWELAFLVYCLDNDIEVKRNAQGFPYEYNNEKHTYYPDFIVDDTLVEIKNYYTPLVQAKINSIPNTLKYKILYYKDLKPYLDYVVCSYGKDFCDLLYDKDKPSYRDRKLKKG